MTVDGIILFNELDLLEIRLRELDPVVDRFVICEARRTFQGNPKPLYFADNRERFRDWLPKIVHVVAEGTDEPRSSNPWDFERYQRNAVERGLCHVPGDAVVMFSDADEIPRASTVTKVVPFPRVFHHEQACATCWLDYQYPRPWKGTRAVELRTIARIGGPDRIRYAASDGIPNGGWHFSYVGGPDRIRAKLRAFSHKELNHDGIVGPGVIEGRLSRGESPFGGGVASSVYGVPRVVPIDTLPACVPGRFDHLLKGKS